jgi:hypothetical protein
LVTTVALSIHRDGVYAADSHYRHESSTVEELITHPEAPDLDVTKKKTKTKNETRGPLRSSGLPRRRPFTLQAGGTTI